MSFAFLLFVSCKGCTPELPPDQDEDSPPPQDSADTQDSSPPVDSDTVDTAPPPLCELVEVEPNDYVDAEELPLKTYACGTFDSSTDQDWLHFAVDEEGWVKVEVQCASRGSSADPEMLISANLEGDAVDVSNSYLTTDVELVFPNAADDYTFELTEVNGFSGEDYGWYTIAYETKAPLSWTRQEVEPNDDETAAEAYSFGDTVFGRISDSGDSDWFILDIPEGVDVATFQVDANKYGSPADINIRVEDAEGTEQWVDHGGEIDYDIDPWREWKLPAAGRYYLKVYQANQDKGSLFHWYTFHVDLTLSADTGSTDTGGSALR